MCWVLVPLILANHIVRFFFATATFAFGCEAAFSVKLLWNTLNCKKKEKFTDIQHIWRSKLTVYGVLCRLHLGVHPTGGTPGPHYLQKSRWPWHKVWLISSCQIVQLFAPLYHVKPLILSVICRMPDPDFSVSDVKLFVGKKSFWSSHTFNIFSISDRC